MPQDSPATQYDKILTDSHKVRSLLENCMAEGERLELEIEAKVRLFYTVLLDHPPEVIEGEVLSPEKLFARKHRPGYLWAGTHLVLAPLVPTIGNMMLKKLPDPKGTLRFFKDVRAFESSIEFLRSEEINGEPVLIFSYPKKLGIINTRRQFRMRIPESFPITVSVTIPDDPDVNHAPVQVLDVSPGGLAFMHRFSEDKFVPEMKVALVIRIPGMVYLKINAFVRNQSPKNPREVKVEGIATRMVVGIQFDINNLDMEEKVNGLVAHLQQSHLADMRDDDDVVAIKGVVQFKSEEKTTPPPTEKPERPKLPEREPITEPPVKEKKEGGWLKGLLGGDTETTEKKPTVDQFLEFKKKHSQKIQ